GRDGGAGQRLGKNDSAARRGEHDDRGDEGAHHGARMARLYRSTFGRHARTPNSKRRRLNDMKKRTLILSTAALVALLVAVPFAYAQHMRAHGMGMRHGGGDGAMRLLGPLAHAHQA